MNPQIAIVGMACRYPDASTPHELFENSLAQRRAFRELPRNRLPAEYFDDSGKTADRAYARQAALINGFTFNREWFRVSRQSFAVTDLTHWLALSVAREAIEDIRFRTGAAHPHKDAVQVVVANTLTGEFSRASLMRLRWPYVSRIVGEHIRHEEPGITDEELGRRLREIEASYKRPFPVPDEDFLAGGLANTIAGRICNHFDFKGGGYLVDGACASSLLAIANACSALEAGDADMVLAGGVDLSLDPFELVGFSRSAALAKREMLVYDEQSEGFWPGEGCGFVALMRYADAVEQCARIHGVIRGWGISSDGRGGLTRPESAGQQLALRRSYARAGYGIETVGYFEGHGTGTRVGDAAELDALITARQARPGPITQAVISSVKANIGHTKAAAGLAGLLRAVTCVGEHVLPATTACHQPHRLLIEHAGNLTALPQPRHWAFAGVPRRAGISAMGFGGINTHVTIEEAPARARTCVQFFDKRRLSRLATSQDAELFLFAASSRGDLSWTIDHVAAIAGECSRSDLTDLAVELARRATRGTLTTWRAAVVAATPAELSRRLSQLRQLASTADDGTVHLKDETFLSAGNPKGTIGLIFPGQGAPAPHAGGAHARRFDEVKRTYEQAGLRSFEDRTDTDFAHSAIVAASIAGLRLLERIGATADVAIGHSLGELSALHWAGHFGEAALTEMAKARGVAIVNEPLTGGAMAAIAADRAGTVRLIGGQPGVAVANINAPRQTIVSGQHDAVAALAGRARHAGTPATMLRIRRAFHSPAMAGAAASFGTILDDLTFTPAGRPVISTVTGDVLDANVDLKAHLRAQLVQPVQFLAAIRKTRVDLFVEVGPGDLMTGLVSSFSATPVVALDVGGQSLAPYLRAAGALFVLGRTPAMARLFQDRFARGFDWSWRPRFFENPCEMFAADGAAKANLAPDPEPEPAAFTVSEDARTADQVRQLIADHAGLPAWTFEDSSRMSSELHLNSITVSEIIGRLALARGLPAPVDPTEYANASIGEIAAALDRLAQNEVAAQPAATRGIASWVRDFEVVRGPARPLSPGDGRAPGRWQSFGTPGAGELLRRLNTEPFGSGAIVWIDAAPGPDDLAALLAAARGGPPRLVVVQHGWGAGGFARSFFLEQPSSDVLVINLQGEPDGDWIAREIAGSASGFREVFIDASGAREEARLRFLNTSATAPSGVLDRRDVVLVTGGGKGISAECGFQLARRTGCALLILGRSAPETEAELAGNLDRLRQAKVRVSYQVADLTDPAAVAAAVTAGTADLGSPVTGVIHGAGLNQPRTVASMTVADLEATLAPKVGGLANVLAAVDEDQLKVLSTFSSIIARIGLAGEADYALANEWLSRQTEEFQRRHPDCRCSAIEWSVWSGTGMGQRLGRLDALERMGIEPISIDDGVAEFLRLIESPDLPTRLVVSGRFGEPRTINYDQPAPAGRRFVRDVLVNYPGIEFICQFELSPESDPYLEDHVLDGARLFPSVMALEAMAEAIQVAGPPRIQFRDVAFKTAIVVPESAGSLTVRVVALAGPDGEISLAIRCSSTQFQINHVEARACARQDVPEAPCQPGDDLSSFSPDRSLYGNVLFQRGRFRRIERYTMIEARRCSGRLSADGATQWFTDDLPQSFLLGDAGARDAALHAIQACIPHKIVVPAAVERIDATALDPATAHHMHATEVADRGDELVYNLTICDPAGRPVEHWRNLVLRIVAQVPNLRLDDPLLMAPYFERRLAVSAPRAHLTISFAATGEQRSRRGPHRPDGKPDSPAGSRFRSAAYAAGWRVDVAASVPVGCDLQTVTHRENSAWEMLLGAEGMKLASAVSNLLSEPFAVSATRVWTIREAMKKAGFPPTAPVVLDPGSEPDWAIFQSGNARSYSTVIAARGPNPATCITTTLRKTTARSV